VQENKNIGLFYRLINYR